MNTTHSGRLLSSRVSGDDGILKLQRTSHRPHNLGLYCAALSVFAAGVVTLGGCKKAEAPVSPPGTVQMAGVKLDLPKLEAEFQDASPEIQAVVKQIKASYRRGRFESMVMDLDALGGNPSLSVSQKKLVADLIEQMKQVLAKLPPPPG